MATATLSTVDRQLREAVVRELEWDPEVDAAGIGVAAQRGVITLGGFIDTYAGKLAAERAAKRVRGVRAVANEVQVRRRLARADDAIAADAATALATWTHSHPGVQASVRSGHVTLTGTVRWLFHKEWAEEVLRHLPGVVALTNHIEVRPDALPADVHDRITAALHRVADLHGHTIAVSVTGNVATLSGSVSSWSQRDAAGRAASAAPGIARVDNLLVVVPVGPPEPIDPEC